MAQVTPRDLLKDHEARIAQLEAIVAQLKIGAESKAASAWDEPIDLDVTSVPAPPVASRPDAQPAAGDAVAEGIVVTQGADSSDIQIPPPDRAQRAIRERLLPLLAFQNLPKQHMLEQEDAEAAYLQGGPYWLYCFDRDYIMGLSEDVRRPMIVDLEHTDQKLAHEVARDILKDAEGGVPMDTQIEQHERETAAWSDD